MTTLRLAGLAGALTLCLGWTPAAQAQKAFASPEAAMDAFGDAVARSDDAAMHVLLGADYHRFIPPAGADLRYRFLEAWAKAHSVKREGDAKAMVAVGSEGWTLPIRWSRRRRAGSSTCGPAPRKCASDASAATNWR